MKYMLLIYNNPVQVAAADSDELVRGHAELYQDLSGAGRVVSSAALAASADVATVRVNDGVPAVTDGPFLEAKEYLAGYYVIECESRDEALEIAARVPCGPTGGVEVRPIDEQVTAAVRGEAG